MPALFLLDDTGVKRSSELAALKSLGRLVGGPNDLTIESQGRMVWGGVQKKLNYFLAWLSVGFRSANEMN